MSTTLKVGCIGVGGIVNSHMPGWDASTDAQVVAGADISEEAVNRWGDQHDIARRCTDSGELITDPDIDIIDICTPNAYHAPLAIAAMEAGKHVICEKPLAVNPDEIRQMIEARDRTSMMLMTAQHFRFSGASKALKAEIDTGVLGDVYHARDLMLRRGGAPTNRPGFYMKKHSGGGPCIDIGVHILDLTLWMMGNPRAVSVTGVTRDTLAKQPGTFSEWDGVAVKPEWDVEEFAAAFVRFETGATLILEVSWFLHHNTDDAFEDMQMWLYGSKGGSHWPKCEIYSTDIERQQYHNTKLMRTSDKLEAHAQECVEFAAAVKAGAPSPVPAEQSLQVMTILDGVYRSHEAGGEIRLDGE